MRLYTDLDETLIHAEVGPYQEVLRIHPRPGAEAFLGKLSRRGELWLLTAAMEEHARNALRVLGPKAAGYLSGIICREQLSFVEAQIRVVAGARVSKRERRELWDLIRPIAPPGPIFDDFPVGSDMFVLKSTAVGVGPADWIQVSQDPDGLQKAYDQFRARFGTGTRTRMVHA